MRIHCDNAEKPIAGDQRRTFALFLTVALALFAALFPGFAMAQTNWNVSTGSWMDAGNWTSGVPTGSANAFIDNGGISQVMLPGAQASSIRIGNSAAGELEIAGGGQLASASTSFIGYSSTGSGVATVSGIGATWSNSQSLYIGNHGAGKLTVSDGGSVLQFSIHFGFHAGSLGTANVGSGGMLSSSSNTVQVASNGTGILTISEGGVVSSRTGGIATGTNGNGTVLVTGMDSNWTTSSSFSVGSYGTGVLEITSGGSVLVGTSCSIGENAESDGTVLVTDENTIWAIENELRVGERGVGDLTISAGGNVTFEVCWIGKESGSNGTVTVAGVSSTLLGNNALIIGENGSGELVISDGGSVEVANSVRVGPTVADGSTENVRQIRFNDGTLLTNTLITSGERLAGAGNVNAHGLISNLDLVFDMNHGLQQEIVLTNQPGQNVVINLNVDGTGALGAGFGGDGSLTIADGVVVTSSSGTIGLDSNSLGTATVAGQLSTWSMTSSLVVGRFGTGELGVYGGGRVVSGSGHIGWDPLATGSIVINGSGSTWSCERDVYVGLSGNGNLSIDDGGSVSARIGLIASENGAIGTVTVSGEASHFSLSQSLYIGSGSSSSGGIGTITIGLGGTVSVGTDTTLFPRATINLEGGTLSTTAIKYQGTGGQFNWTSGTLHVGTYNGNLANPGGTLAPGQSAGSTTISGSYTQGASGTLEIEIGGLMSGTQHDFVSVTGATSLNGELQLALLGDYVPYSTDIFIVLSSTGVLTGTFANVANAGRLDTTDGRGSFLVHYGTGSAFNPKQIVLTDFAFAGDYNGDGVVNAADYVLWRDTDGSIAGYNKWHAHFGLAEDQSSGQSLNAAVPEPTALRLILGTIVAVVYWARRSV